MPGLSDCIKWILTEASEEDIEQIYAAGKQRSGVIRALRAAIVSVDMETQLSGLSPKYLNSMRGTIVSIKGKRADVRLDEKSTNQLRWAGMGRFVVADGDTAYVLTGIPLSCCLPTDQKGTP